MPEHSPGPDDWLEPIIRGLIERDLNDPAWCQRMRLIAESFRPERCPWDCRGLIPVLRQITPDLPPDLAEEIRRIRNAIARTVGDAATTEDD